MKKLSNILNTIAGIIIFVIVFAATTAATIAKYLGVIDSNPFDLVKTATLPILMVCVFGIVWNFIRLEKFKNVKEFLELAVDKDCRQIMIEDIFNYIKKDYKSGAWYARSYMRKIIILTMIDGAIFTYMFPFWGTVAMVAIILLSAVCVCQDMYKRLNAVFAF